MIEVTFPIPKDKIGFISSQIRNEIKKNQDEIKILEATLQAVYASCDHVYGSEQGWGGDYYEVKNCRTCGKSKYDRKYCA